MESNHGTRHGALRRLPATHGFTDQRAACHGAQVGANALQAGAFLATQDRHQWIGDVLADDVSRDVLHERPEGIAKVKAAIQQRLPHAFKCVFDPINRKVKRAHHGFGWLVAQHGALLDQIVVLLNADNAFMHCDRQHLMIDRHLLQLATLRVNAPTEVLYSSGQVSVGVQQLFDFFCSS